MERVIYREYQASVFKLLSNIDRLAALSISMWVGREIRKGSAALCSQVSQNSESPFGAVLLPTQDGRTLTVRF